MERAMLEKLTDPELLALLSEHVSPDPSRAYTRLQAINLLLGVSPASGGITVRYKMGPVTNIIHPDSSKCGSCGK